MTAILYDLEPGVIDTAMIMKSLEEERPTGEAGRLAAEEGVVLKEVTRLRLEFLNILKIDHLWMMTSLVKLQLSSNIIEKIEGLGALVNLKELDLSFNNIEVIENIDVLVKLEVLTLFENKIKKIENMDTLVELMIFSIGNNKVDDLEDVIYLRQFPHLHSLNMAGNPCTEYEDCDFRQYISAFLPKLTYYEYRLITTDERKAAQEKFQTDLDQIQELEDKKKHIRDEEEARAKELAFHAEAFVENLDGDQLFQAMFENDVDGKALLLVGDAAKEIYNNFHDEAVAVLKELFKVGLQQYNIRQEEIKQYFQCVDTAKENDRVSSQQYMENFLQKKSHLFLEIREVLQIIEEQVTEDEVENKGEQVVRLQELADEFSFECHNAWYKLMSQELTLFEQMEDTNGTFERNMNDLVSIFIEAAQAQFVQIRNLEATYGEEIAEVANTYLTNLAISPSPLPPELKHIMVDKESLNGATTQSHDVHIGAIDAREDLLISRIHTWVENYCDEIHKNELKRSRQKVVEINHFLDVQREEFGEFCTFSLDIHGSRSPSVITAGESEGSLTTTMLDGEEGGLASIGLQEMKESEGETKSEAPEEEPDESQEPEEN